MMSANVSDIAILNIKGYDSHCIISSINKNDAIGLMQNADLIKKSATLQIKKIFFLKSYIKMEKIIIKLDDIKIAKQKYHQDKRPILIKNVDNDKIVVSNKALLVNMDLNILLAMKMLKKLDLYMYFFPKWVHVEKTLMKLN